jgi:hypothetical protein
VSPGAPDSPDRSCQEPASTVRRHEQFADVDYKGEDIKKSFNKLIEALIINFNLNT